MARKKKSKFDWSLVVGVLTIVSWCVALCGVAFGTFCWYEAMFNTPVLEVAVVQLTIGGVTAVVPYVFYRLISDFI